MTEAVRLADAEFLQIEEFISRTARGRAFLREHTRRAQAGISDEVRLLVAELRDLWRQQTEATNLGNRIAVLRHELQDMSASISHARREIAAIKPAGDGKDRILSATNELDAIIVSTEHASGEILTSAERILDLLSRLRAGADAQGLANEVEAEVMNIFTACSFQDLTGQRTTKVINVLRYIEQRIGALIELWGVSEADARNIPTAPEEQRPDGHLLHGPSMDGIDQDAVDHLLAGPYDEPGRPAGDGKVRPGGGPMGGAPARSEVAGNGTPEIRGGKGAATDADAPVPLDQSAVDALFG